MSGDRTRTRGVVTALVAIACAVRLSTGGDADDVPSAATQANGATTASTASDPSSGGEPASITTASTTSGTNDPLGAPGDASIVPGADPLAAPLGEYVAGATPAALTKAGEVRLGELTSTYREAGLYPAWSYPLPRGVDPILAHGTGVTKKASTMPDGATISVELSSWSVVADQTLMVTARLTDEDGAPIAVKSGTGTVYDTGLTGWQEKFALATTPTMGMLVASWKVPPREVVEGDPGVHTLVIDVTSAAGTEASLITSIQIGAPALKLTGRYRDAIVDGSLVLGVEVTATKRVRAHVAATLAADEGTGVHTLAQAARYVDVGTEWIDVTFHGRSVRALGADGPYHVVALRLSDTSTLPAQRLPVEAAPWTTRFYALRDFRDDAFDRPDLAALATFLEAR